VPRAAGTVVLLHGFTGAPASWDDVAALLGPGAAVVRPALLGHGDEADDLAADFAGEVDRIAARLPRAGSAPLHLVGYSLGARVALGLLARHPERFSRATLIGVHPGLTGAGERAARVDSDERWAQRLEEGGIAAFVDAWQRQALLEPASPLDERRLARQRQVRLSHRAAGLSRSLRVLGLGRMPDYRQALGACAVPLRLVVGAADRRFTALAEEIRRLQPRAALSVVEGAGHNVPLEQPARVAALLDESQHPQQGATP